MPPGTSFSCEEAGGASEAMVAVKEVSSRRSELMSELRRVSAAVVCACRKRRAERTWAARRSVGVGPGEEWGMVSGVEGVYFGVRGGGGRSS